MIALTSFLVFILLVALAVSSLSSRPTFGTLLFAFALAVGMTGGLIVIALAQVRPAVGTVTVMLVGGVFLITSSARRDTR